MVCGRRAITGVGKGRQQLVDRLRVNFAGEDASFMSPGTGEHTLLVVFCNLVCHGVWCFEEGDSLKYL
jgi:hypothetical protein